MAAPPPPNVALDLSRTTGQILIAAFVATTFYGIQIMQTILYLTTTNSDERVLKCLVVFFLVLITLHEILSMRALWNMLIPKFGDIENFIKVVTQILYALPVAGVVTLLAQLFFTWRIWRFTRKNWLFPIVLIPASVGQLVGYVVYAVKGIGKPVPVLQTPVMTRLTSGIGLLVAIVDILIAVIMCTILWKSRTGQFGSNRVIIRLMNAAVSTGACTAVFAIYGVITSLAFPNDFLYALGLIPIPSLYCNTVLANLNSRRYFQRSNTTVDIYPWKSTGHSVELGTFATSTPNKNTPAPTSSIRGSESFDKSGSSRSVVVHVEHETTRMTDS